MPNDSNVDNDRNNKGRSLGGSNAGNFKNDPQRASQAGRKGGEHSHAGRQS